MLLIEVSVRGSRSPSVSLLACSASSNSGFASSSWLIVLNSSPRLPRSVDVPRSAAGSRASAARA
eukprot:scaffold38857_cov63-Phaeocystis_antarctica.AAC.6